MFSKCVISHWIYVLSKGLSMKFSNWHCLRKLEFFLKDCGIPQRNGMDPDKINREDAIGLRRRIHASCFDGYQKFGSGRLVCQSNGEWKYDILCEEAGNTLFLK